MDPAKRRTTHESRPVDPRALVFDRMADGVIVTDLDGRVIDWNPAATRIFGYSKKEMLGRTVGRLYRIEDARELEATVLRTIESRQSWMGELSFVRRDGRVGISETCVFALRDGKGRRVAAVGVNRDVTERRRIEHALAESYSMLQAVVDGTTDCIFVKNPDGRYVMVNSACARILGRPTKAIIGRDDTDLFPPEEAREIMALDRSVMESGRPYTFEETVTFGGRQVRMSTTKVPWLDARGAVVGLIGIARDVTAFRQAEDEARRHQADLAHLLRVRTVGEMAAGLAHEINQPLAAISNYAKGCARRLRDGEAYDGEVLAAVDEIGLQALRAGAIVHRLGDFVRNRPAQRKRADLNEVIRAAVRLVEPDARREGVRLAMQLGRGAQVDMDPIQIEQVLLNLLRNAIESIRDGACSDGAVTIRARLVGRTVRVGVTDNGPGLRAPAQTIFLPFYTTKLDGMGMGLAISRSIVEAHGGRLWVGEPTNGGASFYVELRRA